MTVNGMQVFEDDLEPLEFKIGQETFRAVPMMPGMGPHGAFVWTKRLADTVGHPEEQEQLYRDFFSTFLLEPGRTRFLERLESLDEPIGWRRELDIFDFMMERYGMRPTRPSSDSSGGSDDQASGTSSTDGARSPVSTPAGSPSTDSST